MTRAFFLAVLAVVTSACAAPAGTAPAFPGSINRAGAASTVSGTLRVRLNASGRTTTRVITLEEYVRGATLSEFAPGSGDTSVAERMLELQAIVSRTYALAHVGRHKADGFDLCATTHCQLYDPERLGTSRWGQLMETAAARTTGKVLWHESQLALTFFHADCGGHTSAAFDVWGGAGYPYLAARPDPAHESKPWSVVVSGVELAGALKRGGETRVGSRIEALAVLARDAGGRATRVRIEGNDRHAVELSGERFRSVINSASGSHALRSTRFDISRSVDGFTFVGQGFGHGVGLCQAGALARLQSGLSVEEVLAHYYPGATISTF